MAVCGGGGGAAAACGGGGATPWPEGLFPGCCGGGGAGEVAPFDGVVPPFAWVVHEDSEETVETTEVQSDTGLGQLAGEMWPGPLGESLGFVGDTATGCCCC